MRCNEDNVVAIIKYMLDSGVLQAVCSRVDWVSSNSVMHHIWFGPHSPDRTSNKSTKSNCYGLMYVDMGRYILHIEAKRHRLEVQEVLRPYMTLFEDGVRRSMMAYVCSARQFARLVTEWVDQPPHTSTIHHDGTVMMLERSIIANSRLIGSLYQVPNKLQDIVRMVRNSHMNNVISAMDVSDPDVASAIDSLNVLFATIDDSDLAHIL
jgi:hypothetical protein